MLPALLFLPVLHYSTQRVLPWKWNVPKTEELLHQGIVGNLGHCVGCVKCVTLGLERRFFLFGLLNPTSSGKEPATNIIRWIFKRTKAPLRLLHSASGKKRNRNPIKHTHSVCVCTYTFIAPGPWYFVQIHFFQKIISLIISHFPLFTYLFSKVLKTGCDIRSAKVQTKAERHRGKHFS